MPRLKYFALFVIAGVASAQNASYEGNPAIKLSNDKLALTIMQKGSTLASIVLKDDPDKLNPLWNPMRMARELGEPSHYDGGAGLFVCVDGFGPPSAEERAAGLPMHGEAHAQLYKVDLAADGRAVTLEAELPIVHEKFTRTFRIAEGETVARVDSRLESELGFDRPVNWAEHATIGSPFLEPGVTVVDLSGSRSQNRPYEKVDNGPVKRRLASGKDFTWPLAPGLQGEKIDLRKTPEQTRYLDHATTLLDPKREWEWVTALNPKKHLLIGYLFRRSDYPWLQYWGNYPPSGKLARGMEFATQPYDVPRREAISMASLFGTPTYHWLPAKSVLETTFFIFYTRVAAGVEKIDDVRMENGQIVIQSADKTIHLAAAALIDDQRQR